MITMMVMMMKTKIMATMVTMAIQTYVRMDDLGSYSDKTSSVEQRCGFSMQFSFQYFLILWMSSVLIKLYHRIPINFT